MRRWLWFGLFAIEMLYLSSRKYASALRVLPPSHCAKSTIFHSKQTLFFRKGLFDGFGRGLTTLNVENLLNGKKVSKSLDGPDGEIVASPAKKEPESIRFRCNPPPVSYVLNSTHVIFTVYGEPMALARHRASKFGIMYNPCAKFQKQFLTACTPYLPTVPHPGPIVATINFYLARPKNHYGSGKNAHILKKNAPSWPSKRLDIDNLVKFVFDALNGNAYDDDAQITHLTTGKYYSEGEGRTEVILKYLHDSPESD